MVTLVKRFETKDRLPNDKPLKIDNMDIVIFGMGNIGTNAYDIIKNKYNKRVIGIDCQKEVILKHLSEGRKVLHGDATDDDFWLRVQPSPGIYLILLATSNHSTHMDIVNMAHKRNSKVKISAICRYDDEIKELKDKGAHVLFNMYSESGAGFAEHTMEKLQNN